MRKLQPYHYAWLSAHPERSKDWLRFMMRAGFDIHHLDGDHDNNTADNLVLIEHRDHMRLHGMRGKGRIEMQHVMDAKKAKRLEEFLKEGQQAYETAAALADEYGSQAGFWRRVATAAKMKHGSHATSRAKLWANQNNLPWPLTTYAVVKRQRARQQA